LITPLYQNPPTQSAQWLLAAHLVGLAMQPVKVQSYSEFVELYGDTVAGGGNSGDVYRDGNYSSPMYGTYAAKAFLRSNVAPLTYVRLLGTQNANN
jgi:hypothetical protein